MSLERPADPLERAVDDLYKLPPGEFIAARNALAKEQTGEARARVRRLEKPTAVPWAVNQLYWRDRPAFDRLMKAGAALRQAQVDAIEGRPADVPKTAAAHRDALKAAVARGVAIAAPHVVHPDPESLARMLETLSIAADRPASPGRLTEAVRPSGFEAVAGLAPAGRALREVLARPPAKADRAREGEARQRERQATIDRARAALEAAEAGEARVQMRLRATREQLAERERDAREARAEVQRARSALRRAGKPPA